MISIEKARTYLDEKTNKEMTDEQVAAIMADCYTLADIVIDDYLEKKKLNKGGSGVN